MMLIPTITALFALAQALPSKVPTSRYVPVVRTPEMHILTLIDSWTPHPTLLACSKPSPTAKSTKHFPSAPARTSSNHTSTARPLLPAATQSPHFAPQATAKHTPLTAASTSSPATARLGARSYGFRRRRALPSVKRTVSSAPTHAMV